MHMSLQSEKKYYICPIAMEGQCIETKLCKNSSGNPDDTDELGQDETPHTIDTAAQGLHKNTKKISSFFV